MKRTHKQKVPSAEELAKIMDRGGAVSQYFTGKGKMMTPIQRVNVDFTGEMLTELDETARALNISRQAVIKMFVRQSLDQHYLAKKSKRAG